jgi:hypothetical protein
MMYFDGLDDIQAEQTSPDTGAAYALASPALFEMFTCAGCTAGEGLALAGFIAEQ